MSKSGHEEDRMLAAAYKAAADSVRLVWDSDGSVDPRTQVGRLTDQEILWIVSMAISTWINERHRQWTALRNTHFSLDAFIQQYDANIDPRRRGELLAVLPSLGQWCASQALTNKPITAWSKEEIVSFIELAWDLVEEFKHNRDEDPDDTPEAVRLLEAG